MKRLHALGIAQGDELLVVLAVCAACLADFERDAAVFAAHGQRLVCLENPALVHRLRDQAKRQMGEHGGCAGCVMDKGGTLRMDKAHSVSVSDLQAPGGEA